MTETQQKAPKAPQETSNKRKVFIFTAQDGRVGKTTACKMFIHNMQQVLKQHPIVVDTDPMNPNVARSYTPEIVKYWSSSITSAQKGAARFFRNRDNETVIDTNTTEGKINKMLSSQIVFDGEHHVAQSILALTEFSRDVVVNVSGNTYIQMCNFLASQQADKLDDLDLYICWVTNGTKESLDLFTKTQRDFDGAKYLLIFNEGNTQYIKHWDNYYLTPEIAKLVSDEKIKIISLPLLSVPPDFWHEHQNLPYTQWLQDESIDKYRRNSIQVWIDTACQEITQSKCL